MTRHVSTGPAAAQAAFAVGDFDLNIERVLEGWDVSHAVRELIANALDEQALTETASVEIARVARGVWTIRDHGRGLRHVHLTQNESPEKREREREVIGRFGVGLKDALAVLDRRKVDVTIGSAHGVITLVHRAKVGFADVTTLHARVALPNDPRMRGTEVRLSGVRDEDVETAKGYFLRFSGESVLEETRYGQILKRPNGRTARIYVKGLVVAEEADFAFSYNVTALTQPMRKALNRERTNVGRSAYADRAKAMLLLAESEAVASMLVDEVQRLADGTSHEEVRTWSDVGLRACQILNARRQIILVTAEQLVNDKEMVDRALEDGRTVITVPATIAQKLGTVRDIAGKPMQSLAQFASDWAESVEYRFVEEGALTKGEREVFRHWRAIATSGGGLPKAFRELKISETMRPSVHEGFNPAGLWEAATGRVIIHRGQLARLSDFAGTLLHELTHARTGFTDVSRDFELALTDLVGRLTAEKLTRGHS
jgi:hypothetical protein